LERVREARVILRQIAIQRSAGRKGVDEDDDGSDPDTKSGN